MLFCTLHYIFCSILLHCNISVINFAIKCTLLRQIYNITYKMCQPVTSFIIWSTYQRCSAMDKNSTEIILIVSVLLFIPRPLLWAQSHLLVQHSVPAKAAVDVRVVQVEYHPCCNMRKHCTLYYMHWQGFHGYGPPCTLLPTSFPVLDSSFFLIIFTLYRYVAKSLSFSKSFSFLRSLNCSQNNIWLSLSILPQ